ncbi:MAG TPA: nitroreductase/quinone reductase family protein [Terriglobales bacterium]|nr:nitroreductase/quinone reductase family protein [Terriglobales bacterium]
MELKDERVYLAWLTTIGRKSGLKRSVQVRLLYLQGRFYATTSRVESKHWCRNMVQNPAVEVSVAGRQFRCRARRLADEKVRSRVLTLRDSPGSFERAVFEIAPECGP